MAVPATQQAISNALPRQTMQRTVGPNGNHGLCVGERSDLVPWSQGHVCYRTERLSTLSENLC